MREHDRRRDEPEARARREAPPPVSPLERLFALQRSAGNRAVGDLLARQAAPPAVRDQAAAEAEAVQAVALLRGAHQTALRSPDTRIRNTALMIDPPGERSEGRRVRVTPMTLRSDSAQLVASHGTNAATTAYYFYGTHQDNEHEDGPNTLGTIEGDGTIVIRGHDPTTGALRSQNEIVGTFVHETSHIIVADYGEHPGTSTDAGSFDRYRDEFRAYFIEPFGPFSGIANLDDRAHAIRDHMVGTSAGAGTYADLDNAFWATPLATNQFRTQVLGHLRPDGFNLNSSPYLDRLVHLLREVQDGRSTVEQALFQITVLSPDERTEAANATLIATLLGRLPAAGADRLRRALTAPAAVGFGRDLNPNQSPRVTAFLEAVTARDEAQIVDTYHHCDPQDRADLEFNAHFLSWVGRVLPSEQLMRTCVICMVTGRSFVYFDRVRVFAQACSAAAGAAEMPEALRTALRGLSFEVRLAYYRFCEDDYRTRVEPLQDPVKREVRAILRGDAEP